MSIPKPRAVTMFASIIRIMIYSIMMTHPTIFSIRLYIIQGVFNLFSLATHSSNFVIASTLFSNILILAQEGS